MELQDGSVLISLAALGVAIWSVITSRRTSTEQRKLQERFLSLESVRERDRQTGARSAKLRAEIERRAGSHRLLLRNDGPNDARAITVSMDSQPLDEHRLFVGGQELITRLGPGADARYILAVAMGAPPLVTVQLTWEDDTGRPRTWESQLTL